MEGITLYQAKNRCHPTIKEYLGLAQMLVWAFHWHFTLWFHGQLIRDGRTERVLKRLVGEGRLHAAPYLNRKVYSVPRIDRKRSHRSLESIEHGLGITEGYIRLAISDRRATYIPERDFDNPRPEFGLQFEKARLCYEFCTFHNTRKMLKNKIKAYQGTENMVLFVCDVDRADVEGYVKRYPGDYFITDYDAFKRVEYGRQLSAVIYLWGGDGKPYPLGQDVP